MGNRETAVKDKNRTIGEKWERVSGAGRRKCEAVDRRRGREKNRSKKHDHTRSPTTGEMAEEY